MVKIQGVPFGDRMFHNGEAILEAILDGKRLSASTDKIEVLCMFEGNKDIGDLQMAKEYLDDVFPGMRHILYIPAFPYARMDRYIQKDSKPDQLFSLQYFTNILNRMSFDEIYCYDPHSGVTKNRVKNLKDLYTAPGGVSEIIARIIIENGIDFRSAPDQGAFDKYPHLLPETYGTQNIIVPWVHGEKRRNLNERGALLSEETKLHLDGCDIRDKKVLIIDDICVFGGTFLAHAKMLLDAGASEVYLFVTHCENAIFDGKLLGDDSPIKEIHTSDSIVRTKQNEKIKVHKIWKGAYEK
jgi:ribose-phosphate pyrophosphokinase